jgi:hypothetical protein
MRQHTKQLRQIRRQRKKKKKISPKKKKEKNLTKLSARSPGNWG